MLGAPIAVSDAGSAVIECGGKPFMALLIKIEEPLPEPQTPLRDCIAQLQTLRNQMDVTSTTHMKKVTDQKNAGCSYSAIGRMC
jgi:hypothetical protein